MNIFLILLGWWILGMLGMFLYGSALWNLGRDFTLGDILMFPVMFTFVGLAGLIIGIFVWIDLLIDPTIKISKFKFFSTIVIKGKRDKS